MTTVSAAIVHAGQVSFETLSTLSMIAYYQGKKGYEFNVIGAESCLVDQNANNVMNTAREMNCDYLFWIDADIQYLGNGDVVEQMIAHDKDIVVGAYYQGGPPYRPVLYHFTKNKQIKNLVDIPDNDLFRVDAAGGGWMLIKKKVLDLFTPEVEKKLGGPFDPLMKGKSAWLRADAAFFWRLKQLGVEVWVDTSINLGHVKKTLITRDFFLMAKQSCQHG